jgi:hypothetical protein
VIAGVTSTTLRYPSRFLMPALVTVVSFLVAGCSSDDTYLPALLADPMASYQAEGLELSDSWEYAQRGSLLGSGPRQAEVGRTFSIGDQSQAEQLLEDAVEFAESEGWAIRGSLTGRPDFYRGTKDLPPGSARMSISLGAVDPIREPDGPKQLVLHMEYDPVAPTTLPSFPPDELQTTVLADGSVSHAEMLGALEATIDCVAEAGYNARLVSFYPRFGASFESWGEGNDEADLAEQALTECRIRFTSEVEPAYLTEHGLSVEEWSEFEAVLSACLSDQGIPVDDYESLDEVLLDHPEAYGSCEASAKDAFGSV